LRSGSLRPARIIWLLGLDEDAFPRFEASVSLCELSRIKNREYIPSNGDEDRQLFLEMLFCATDYFLMSYERIHPQDNKIQGTSYLIEELCTYLVKDPEQRKTCIIDHPALSFDAMYFLRESQVKNLDPYEYLLARAHYSPKKPIPRFFGKNFSPQRELQRVIDLKSLKKLATQPLAFYFNEVLGIYLKKEEDEERSAFCLSHLHQYILKRAAMKKSLGKVFQRCEKEGSLPDGIFKDAAQHTLSFGMDELLDSLDSFSVSGEEVFSIELSLHCHQAMQLQGGDWIFPALKVVVDEHNIYYIVGKLDEVTPKGLLVNGARDITSLIAAWPLYLVYLNIKADLFSPQLLLSKDGHVIEAPEEDASSLLKSYLEYYDLCHEVPSPLLPKWARWLLLEEEEFEKLSKRFLQADAFSFADPYLEWLNRRDRFFDLKELYGHWAPELKARFKPVLSLLKKKLQKIDEPLS
jgi:exodeoxyribonuclease V gamma subunit